MYFMESALLKLHSMQRTDIKSINVISCYIWNKYKATLQTFIAMNNKFLNLYYKSLRHSVDSLIVSDMFDFKVKSIERNISNSKATEVILRST